MEWQCTYEECDKPKRCKGLCDGHYAQQKKGKALTPLRARKRTVRDETGKVCKRCDTYKPYEEYHVSNAEVDGRQALCKKCGLDATNDMRRKRKEIYEKWMSQQDRSAVS